jgi:anaerobic dimethyl sulfoxide reductase subunit B (iron-sulfur subunit)
MARNGLLIDYAYCSGCHTCEVACQTEHKLPLGEWGIKIMQVGPWPIEGTDKYQFDNIPVPTDQCDLCGDRVAKGKLPTCVHHCQASVMKFGPVDELAKEMEGKRHMVLFTP